MTDLTPRDVLRWTFTLATVACVVFALMFGAFGYTEPAVAFGVVMVFFYMLTGLTVMMPEDDKR